MPFFKIFFGSTNDHLSTRLNWSSEFFCKLKGWLFILFLEFSCKVSRSFSHEIPWSILFLTGSWLRVSLSFTILISAMVFSLFSHSKGTHLLCCINFDVFWLLREEDSSDHASILHFQYLLKLLTYLSTLFFMNSSSCLSLLFLGETLNACFLSPINSFLEDGQRVWLNSSFELEDFLFIENCLMTPV